MPVAHFGSADSDCKVVMHTLVVSTLGKYTLWMYRLVVHTLVMYNDKPKYVHVAHSHGLHTSNWPVSSCRYACVRLVFKV